MGLSAARLLDFQSREGVQMHAGNGTQSEHAYRMAKQLSAETPAKHDCAVVTLTIDVSQGDASMRLWRGHWGTSFLLLFAEGSALPDLVQVTDSPLCGLLQPQCQPCFQLLCMLQTLAL